MAGLDYEGSGEAGLGILANGNRRVSAAGFRVEECHGSN